MGTKGFSSNYAALKGMIRTATLKNNTEIRKQERRMANGINRRGHTAKKTMATKTKRTRKGDENSSGSLPAGTGQSDKTETVSSGAS